MTDYSCALKSKRAAKSPSCNQNIARSNSARNMKKICGGCDAAYCYHYCGISLLLDDVPRIAYRTTMTDYYWNTVQ